MSKTFPNHQSHWNPLKWAGAISVVAAASMLVTACGSSSDGASRNDSTPSANASSGTMNFSTLLAAAKEEAASGTFNVWLSTPKLEGTHKDLFAAFEKKFDLPQINYQWVNTSSPVADNKFLQENKAGKVTADIIGFSPNELGLSMQPLLAPVDWNAVFGQELPSIADAVDDVQVADQFKDHSLAYWDSAKVVMWNTKLTSDSEVPTTVEAFADPKWKGKVALTSTGFDLGDYSLTAGEQAALDMAKKLKANKPILVASSPAAMTAVATGQAAVTFTGTIGTVQRLADEGQPVAWKPLDSGVVLGNQLFGVPAGATHMNLGILFGAWLATDGQAILVKDEMVARFNYADAPGVAELKAKYPDVKPVRTETTADMKMITDVRSGVSKLFTGVGG